MTATRTMTTTLLALAMATILAMPATAAPLSSLPDPEELSDLLSGTPLAQCLPDQPEAVDLAVIAACVLDTLPDIVGNPHAASIVAVVIHGIAEGFADGTFGPQLHVTRGQMATFLDRALDLAPGQASGLRDVAGNTHEAAIDAVVGAGIAEGFADGTFGPQLPVTRGQMATFLDRALDLAPGQASGLGDVAGNTHEAAIDAVVGAGIAEGFADGTFRPQQQVTRGQMATFLTRALDL